MANENLGHIVEQYEPSLPLPVIHHKTRALWWLHMPMWHLSVWGLRKKKKKKKLKKKNHTLRPKTQVDAVPRTLSGRQPIHHTFTQHHTLYSTHTSMCTGSVRMMERLTRPPANRTQAGKVNKASFCSINSSSDFQSPLRWPLQIVGVVSFQLTIGGTLHSTTLAFIIIIARQC